MTVAELIAELEKMQQDMPVRRHDSEWGPEPGPVSVVLETEFRYDPDTDSAVEHPFVCLV